MNAEAMAGGASPDASEDRTYRQRPRRSDESNIREGGGRPQIAPQAPPIVAFTHDFPLNSVLPDGGAYEYAISVEVEILTSIEEQDDPDRV